MDNDRHGGKFITEFLMRSIVGVLALLLVFAIYRANGNRPLFGGSPVQEQEDRLAEQKKAQEAAKEAARQAREAEAAAALEAEAAREMEAESEPASEYLPSGVTKEQLKAEFDYLMLHSRRFGFTEEKLSFEESNPELIHFLYCYVKEDYELGEPALTSAEAAAKYPQLLQWDPRWGYAPYGQSVVGIAGCGPTCLSMVAVGLTRDPSLTPDVIAQYSAEQGFYHEGQGTDWLLFTRGAAHYGITGTIFPMVQGYIDDYLAEGKPVVASVQAGRFTTEGHYIVIVGRKDGRYVVYDPNSRERSSALWSYAVLKREIVNLWGFELTDETAGGGH